MVYYVSIIEACTVLVYEAVLPFPNEKIQVWST